MKNLFVGILSMFLIVGTVNAQTGKKALRSASKLIGKYVSNPLKGAEKLTEGMKMLDVAFQDEGLKMDPKALLKKAALFNNIAEAEMKVKLVDPAYVLGNPDASAKGFDTYKQILGLSSDKGIVKKAMKGLQNIENQLNNTGIVFFDMKDYGKAFKYYNLAVKAYDMLKEGGFDSRLDAEGALKEHLFITGASGYYGDKGAEAKESLMRLKDAGTDKPLVYEALYNIESKAGSADALTYLNKGRELFPEDTGLLFAEINHYLKEGKLDVLIEKLEVAKEKEPDNVSIYNTLGNVYDQMNQKEREAGNLAKADEYFDKSFKNYGDALVKDPTNFDAAYSQGALYYNKAASLTSKINALSEDFSAEGLKKYEALKAQMEGLFDQALPFFQKAESMNDKDPNVLIALKEIYAKKGDFEKSNEYKTRLEAVSGQ